MGGGFSVVPGAVRVFQIQSEAVAAVLQGAASPREVAAGQFHRAQAIMDLERQLQAGATQFVRDKPVVEVNIVRDQHASGQQLHDVMRNVPEDRGVKDVCGADAMDVLRAQVALGIDQCLPAVTNGAIRFDVHDGDFGDAVAFPGKRPVVSTSTTANPAFICSPTDGCLSADRTSCRARTSLQQGCDIRMVDVHNTQDCPPSQVALHHRRISAGLQIRLGRVTTSKSRLPRVTTTTSPSTSP